MFAYCSLFRFIFARNVLKMKTFTTGGRIHMLTGMACTSILRGILKDCRNLSGRWGGSATGSTREPAFPRRRFKPGPPHQPKIFFSEVSGAPCNEWKLGYFFPPFATAGHSVYLMERRCKQKYTFAANVSLHLTYRGGVLCRAQSGELNFLLSG
jgi:hypothetical protein